jgi:hypothetical protein
MTGSEGLATRRREHGDPAAVKVVAPRVPLRHAQGVTLMPASDAAVWPSENRTVARTL